MKSLLGSLFCALLSVPAVSGGQDPVWTWVHGRLEDDERQQEYLEVAGEMFRWYQSKGLLGGRLVAESELDEVPGDRVVLLGPVEAFEDLDAFGLPLHVVGDGEIEIGGRVLDDRRLGIYLTNQSGTRIAYSGLSLDGFRDIFTVPTGRNACTVTRGRGRIHFEGRHGEDGLVLESLPFLEPYPSAEDLESLAVPEGALEVEPVVTGPGLARLTPDFGSWLTGFVEGQRVLFVGESHWNTGVNRIFHRIVEALLERGDVRAVFLEVNYSFSGFYDHYVSEADDELAARFLATRLHPLVASPGTLELLELLRTWNAEHPDERVRVACLDMEWSAQNVVRNVVTPYFRRVDEGFEMPDPYLLKKLAGKLPRERFENLLAEAREKEIVGEYPFLTPSYVERVITNLWDTVEIEVRPRDRQRGILRNVTDFHGELLEEGLVLFKGGGWHAIKRKLPGEELHREAAYLHGVHPATKGKVVTLYLNGVGYGFGELADLDLGTRMGSAANYNGFVRDFQDALADGRAEKDGFYLLDRGLPVFDRLVARTGHATGHDVLRVASVDWEALTGVHGKAVLDTRSRDYDAIVYVLRSGIEVMRPKVFEQD